MVPFGTLDEYRRQPTTFGGFGRLTHSAEATKLCLTHSESPLGDRDKNHDKLNSKKIIITSFQLFMHYSIVIHLNNSSINFDGILYLSLTVYDLSVYLTLCPCP